MAYWSPFSHENRLIDLSHLEPFEISVTTPSGAVRRVFVTFSSHTFTRGIEPADPAEYSCFDSRIFCETRYQLSQELPGILQGFPSVRVFQTWERRSYVYLASVEAGTEGGPYHVFFGLKKRHNQHPGGINLTVESAYRKDPSSYTPPKRPQSVRFGLLVEKVFLNQPLRFK